MSTQFAVDSVFQAIQHRMFLLEVQYITTIVMTAAALLLVKVLLFPTRQ